MAVQSSLPARREPRANALWKGRWGTWVTRSTGIAAAAHAVLFILWPVWNLTSPADREEVIQLIQITPVETPGSPDVIGDGAMTLLPTQEEAEVAIEESRAGAEVVADLDGEVFFESASAGAMYTLTPTISYSPPASPLGGLDGLILEQLAAISPEVAGAGGSVIWPGIRNPTVLTRFLRRSFNRLYRGGASGFVSVALSINERGRVDAAAVSESSGYPALDDIALVAFNDVVVFAPARNSGTAVPITVVISVPFTMPW